MKKVCSILIGTLILMILSVNAFATTDNCSTDAVSSFTKCEFCGQRTVLKMPVRYSEWGYVGEVDCVHEGGKMQRDEREVRLKLFPYVCTNCSFGDSEVVIEERYIHIGKNEKIIYIF